MEKLSLSIISPFSYMINMANQSQDTILDQISIYKVIMGGQKYFLTFHVIHMYLNKNSYSLFLRRS